MAAVYDRYQVKERLRKRGGVAKFDQLEARCMQNIDIGTCVPALQDAQSLTFQENFRQLCECIRA